MKTAFSVRVREMKFLKIQWEANNKFSNFLLYGGPKGSSWWEDSKYGLRIELGTYFTPILAEKKTPKKLWNRDPDLFWRFFGQNMGQILSKFNSETIFGILSSWRTFKIPSMKEIWFVLAFHSIFKISSLVREPKMQFLWEKNDIILLFTSHGTGLAPKAWKKLSSVKNETP